MELNQNILKNYLVQGLLSFANTTYNKAMRAYCRYCGSVDVKKNGFYRLKNDRKVRRYLCSSCKSSFRSNQRKVKRENRGRPSLAVSNLRFRNSYAGILVDMIKYYCYRKNLSFYKASEHLTGRSRQTLRRYFKSDQEKITSELVVKVFVKIKEEIEDLNDGKLSPSSYRRLQGITNKTVSLAVGPPPCFIRGDTVIWNKNSPDYGKIYSHLAGKQSDRVPFSSIPRSLRNNDEYREIQ